jgi:hypothetical protein
MSLARTGVLVPTATPEVLMESEPETVTEVIA